MSFQRDYILRMIEQLGQFLARAVRLATGGKPAEASQQFDAAYRSLLGLGTLAVSRLTADQMLDFLPPTGRDDSALLHALARLLLGEAGTLTDEPDRYLRARVALDILGRVDRPQPEVVAALAAHLAEYDLDPATHLALTRLAARTLRSGHGGAAPS